jgi:hypothetical protein
VVSVKVLSGNITQVKADALITTIRPDGSLIDLIDDELKENTEHVFHDMVAGMSLRNLEAVTISAPRRHHGEFEHVIFVPHTPQVELHKVVMAGLCEAEVRRINSVVLPVIRNGLEVRPNDARDTVLAIATFVESRPSFVGIISIVTNSPRAQQYLKRVFSAS